MKCSACGSPCWAEDLQDEYGECDPDSLFVSEEYPGIYVHYCNNHDLDIWDHLPYRGAEENE